MIVKRRMPEGVRIVPSTLWTSVLGSESEDRVTAGVREQSRFVLYQHSVS